MSVTIMIKLELIKKTPADGFKRKS